MSATMIRVPSGAPGRLLDGFGRVCRELRLPEAFPAKVADEAGWVAKVPRPGGEDLTGLPFVTLGPPGAADPGQAFHLERLRGGYRVWYAVADVGAFVRTGGVLDAEARARGAAVRLPCGDVPLYPAVLAEEAASLLPGAERPAVVWRIDLDGDGRTVGADVLRARVRSRERLDHEYAQAAVETGTADGPLGLLAEIGGLLLALERARGGATLPVPERLLVPSGGGGLRLEYRVPLPAEAWHAQLSLLAGTAAAQLMLEAETGLLRVLPAPRPAVLDRLRRIALALDVPWTEGASYASVVHSLNPGHARHAAFLHEARVLLRGTGSATFPHEARMPPRGTGSATFPHEARMPPQGTGSATFPHEARMPSVRGGYVAFDGAPPKAAEHAAVAAPYAHVTAPLRRLADRYAAEACLAIAAGEPVPSEVRRALAELPDLMAASARRAAAAERACAGLVEAYLLRDRIGQEFEATVITTEIDAGTGARRGTGADARAGAEAGTGTSARAGTGTSARAGTGTSPEAGARADVGVGARADAGGEAEGDAGAGVPGGGAGRGGLVQVADPVVLARCGGDLTPGERVTVRLVGAEPATREVRFALS